MTYKVWQDYSGIGHDVEMDATHETKMLEDYGPPMITLQMTSPGGADMRTVSQ